MFSGELGSVLMEPDDRNAFMGEMGRSWKILPTPTSKSDSVLGCLEMGRAPDWKMLPTRSGSSLGCFEVDALVGETAAELTADPFPFSSLGVASSIYC